MVNELEVLRWGKLEALFRRFCSQHRLSGQEGKLLQMSVYGLTNDEIATALACSRPTISTYWNRIFEKIGLSGQREVLAAFARYVAGQ